MVVGQDIAVIGDDKPGTGCFIRISVTVAAGGFRTDRNTDGGIDVLFIEVGRRKLFKGCIRRVRCADYGDTEDQRAEQDNA